MKLPKLLIAFFLTLVCQGSFGQKLSKIEREYFILGTLNDYMGREPDPELKNYLDRYDITEISLEIAVDSLLRKDYPTSSYKIKRDTIAEFHMYGASIISASLTQKFDAYYNFGRTNTNPVGAGILRKNIFRNDNEKLAFLAGAYVRFGIPNDTSYEIIIGNSASKARVCSELLFYFKCAPIYDIIEENIPVPHIIYFHPAKKVKMYLQQFLYLRERLEASKKMLFSRVRSRKKN